MLKLIKIYIKSKLPEIKVRPNISDILRAIRLLIWELRKLWWIWLLLIVGFVLVVVLELNCRFKDWWDEEQVEDGDSVNEELDFKLESDDFFDNKISSSLNWSKWAIDASFGGVFWAESNEDEDSSSSSVVVLDDWLPK